MRYVNGTQSPIVLTFCCADHWDIHGSHDYGDYQECIENNVTVGVGGDFEFDSTADNGPYLVNLCETGGLT